MKTGRRSRSQRAEHAQAKQRALGQKTYTAQEIAQMKKSGQLGSGSAPGGSGGQVSNVSQSQIEPSAQFQTFNQNTGAKLTGFKEQTLAYRPAARSATVDSASRNAE